MAARFQIGLAEQSDEAELRRRMAMDRMEGDIVLSFRREPDYFLACRVQGDSSQIIKCTDTDTGGIVGLGARHCQRLYVNGREMQIGYLSDLRADPSVRRGTLLARGYALLRELHDQHPLPLYFSVILQGNRQAIKALSGARGGLPVYEDRGQILTPAIHLDRPLPPVNCNDARLQRADAEMIPRVFEFLRRELACKQFAPSYDPQDLSRGRLQGLAPSDFYVAVRGDRVVGCVAAWDQSGFRQTHVEEYSGRLKLARPFYNLAARFTSMKSLPPPGGKIRFLYLGLIATEGNRPDLFASLLRSIYIDRRNSENHFMIAGLHERDPLAAVLNDYRKIEAGGRLYLIYYPEQKSFMATLDNRTPYIEMASV